MNIFRFVCTTAAFVGGLCIIVVLANSQGGTGLDDVYRKFANPPDDARIMMRWWWFGPAVDKAELERELLVMKGANIGGVEIQPVYPLELDDPQKGFHNAPYLSEEFLSDLRFASETAKSLGLRVDITLGSGWPYGGPLTPVTQAAGRLRIERLTLTGGESSAAVPAMENGERLIASFLAPGDAQQVSPDDLKLIETVENGRAVWGHAVDGPHTVLFFISSRTGQQVKRPSVGAEGFVLDHFDRAAIENHLHAVGDRLMRAFGDNPPYAVFSDSLEVFGSDWTDDFLSEFQRRRGYDLTPYLPALVTDMGPTTAAIRHDWGKTLSELVDERYLVPIREWAHAHHTLFRSQTYGEPPVEMSANDLVDLPEGEHGPEWRQFSAARWASSACHLYGRPITSTETWTWLHAPSFRATPLDMKAEADLHFIEGINQLIGHGWPYAPPSAGEPGWRFYASGAFNDHNPWFDQAMPELAKYLQRMSYLMQQGSPANDIAIYLPTDDAWAQFDAGRLDSRGHYRPAEVSIDRSMEKLLGTTLIPQILDAGYNFDFIDDGAIAKAGVRYKVLIVPGVERMPLATLQRMRDFAAEGGIVIATRRLPSLAPGLKDENDGAKVESMARTVFTHFVDNEQALGAMLKQLLTPDFALDKQNDLVGFVHRKFEQGAFYFVANTSNQIVSAKAHIRVTGMAAESWDPFTGAGTPLVGTSDGKCTTIQLSLPPYGSQVIVFRPGAMRQGTAHITVGAIIDISSDWKVRFERLHKSENMPKLRSWTDNPETEFYSGTAVYEKTVTIPDSMAKSGTVQLDFGNGEPVAPSPMPNGMRALLESPVRESAVVYVNGQLAGCVWRPPYGLQIEKFLRPGQNQLRIVVANLAINEMAGKALPTYTLLKDKYGDRFQPQGFENFHALPAGMLGPVHLMSIPK